MVISKQLRLQESRSELETECRVCKARHVNMPCWKNLNFRPCLGEAVYRAVILPEIHVT